MSLHTSPQITMPSAHERGFTLIELSIVLVIIGLIVGGVLTGQDLIKAAETRGTIGQVEKFNTAVYTFRSKYNGMPGDVLNAASLGFVTRTGAAGHGDGNGLLEGGSAAATVALGETVLFWTDLSTANIVDGNFIGTDTAAAISTPADYFAGGKVGQGNYFTVYAANGVNYYQLTGVTSTTAAGVYTLYNALTPIQAYNMDVKIDDGKPLNGTVVAMEGTGPLNTTAVAGAATCVFTGGLAYNMTTPALGSSLLCQLRFRFN